MQVSENNILKHPFTYIHIWNKVRLNHATDFCLFQASACLVFHSLLTSHFCVYLWVWGLLEKLFVLWLVILWTINFNVFFSIEWCNQFWLEQYTDASYNNYYQSNTPGRLIHLLKCIAFKQICARSFYNGTDWLYSQRRLLLSAS